MRVTKHGKKYRPPIKETCTACGCEFEHDRSEGKYSHTRNYEYRDVPTEDVYSVECPECGERIYYAVVISL
jgi:predicted RNA-binding Zn-ribbon protein involved in translation (DUF1610 family)